LNCSSEHSAATPCANASSKASGQKDFTKERAWLTHAIGASVRKLTTFCSAPRSRSSKGQTPLGKMIKCDDFVYIFHGKRFAKRGAPVDKTLVLEQTLKNKFFKVVVGALTVSPLPRRRLRLLLLPILLVRSLGRHFLIRSPRVARGLRRKGRRDLVGLGLSKE
jgi:hypothetical protein